MERLPSRPPAVRTWRASRIETSLLGRDPRRHRSIQHQRIHPCQTLCPGCETQRAGKAAWEQVWPRVEENTSPLGIVKVSCFWGNHALPGWIPCLHRPRALGISHALHVMCLARLGKEGVDLQHGSVVTQSNIDLMEPSMVFDEFVQREGESHSIQDDGARPRRSCPSQFVSVGRTSLFYIPVRVPSEDLAHERVPIRRRWSDAGSLRPRRRRSKGSTSRASEGCETVFLVWAHA